MHFDVIYDISEAGCRDGFLPICFGALTLYAGIAWYRGKRWTSWRTWDGWTLGGVAQAAYSPRNCCLFFALLTLLSYAMTWGSYFALIGALRNGTATTLEGIVSNFHPAANLKETESFVVDGHAFSYSKYALRQGFHTLELQGSPIADGAYVRLSYRNDSILKLEIRR